jgi:glycosyltransferase involved in cell wall biosynthesis
MSASVVVFTPDVVGARMAGPGIRAYYFAAELAKHFPTTLVAQLIDFDAREEKFSFIDARGTAAPAQLRRAGVVIGQPRRELLSLNGPALIFDLFDPVVLELQQLYANGATFRQKLHLRREWGRLHAALRRGDVLIAGAPRQRDFYAGVHAVADGISGDWSSRWIEVPFGIDETPPPATAHARLRAGPPLVLWGGGTWEWLDPETAIRAVTELNRSGVPCRLLFLGGRRPNSQLPALDTLGRFRTAIQEAGDAVLINEDWVPYRERGGWLRAAKVAIMLHGRTLEAEFSIRTRLFDAIWCSLPVVVTAGGFAADLVRTEGLGVVVEPSDVSAVAAGIEKLLRDDAFYAQSVSNLNRIRERYRWSEVIRPLVRAVEQRG